MSFPTLKDWDGIVQDFREGMTLPAIAEKHGITLRGLRKGLDKRGLTRSLSSSVRELAQQQANDDLLRNVGTPVNMDRVEALAEVSSAVLVRHRNGILAAQHTVTAMLQELRQLCDNPQEVEEAIMQYFSAKIALSPLQMATLRGQMMRALGSVSLAARAAVIDKLAGAMEKLIKLERQALRLDDNPGEKTYEDYLREMHSLMAEQKAQQMDRLIAKEVA